MKLSMLIMILLLASISACSFKEPISEANASLEYTPLNTTKSVVNRMLNDIWALERIQSDEVFLVDGIQRPRLEVQLHNMKLIGHDGCNGFFANINYIDNETITFGPIAGTRMFCHPMDIPDRFNQQLNRVKRYQLKDLKLHLFDAEGEELLQFQKID